MQVLYDRCCGLDIHKKRVNACLILSDPQQGRQKERQTFQTTTADLRRLATWLATAGCTQVAMESTGAYWKPVYNVLEETCTIVLANPQHIKALPGRKTDVGDAEWIADLLQHGLIRSSFIPPRPQRELRELTRYRKSLVQERASEVNRVQKVLEGGNIKLASVASNILGASGRAMLTALTDGINDPTIVADLAQGKLRRKIPELRQALDGMLGSHQTFLLLQQLAHIDTLDEAIDRCSAEIATRLDAETATIERLCTIPGIGRRVAEVLLAEIGSDMSRFPTAQHLASWAGMCPGNHESAGKQKTGRTRKGNVWLRGALMEAARAAARTRDTYLNAQHRRIAARRGGNRATVAVGHTILIIVYHLLQEGGVYEDLGSTYFDQLDRERTQRRLVKRLETLGYSVSLQLTTDSDAETP